MKALKQIALVMIQCLIIISSISSQTKFKQLERSEDYGQLVSSIDTIIIGTDTSYAIKYVDKGLKSTSAIRICKYILRRGN